MSISTSGSFQQIAYFDQGRSPNWRNRNEIKINLRRSVQRKQRWSIAETGNLFSFCTALRYPDKNRLNGKVGKLTSTMSIIYRSLNIKVLRQNPHHTWYLSFFIPAHFEAWNLQVAEYESTASDCSLMDHVWNKTQPYDRGQFWPGPDMIFVKIFAQLDFQAKNLTPVKCGTCDLFTHDLWA